MNTKVKCEYIHNIEMLNIKYGFCTCEIMPTHACLTLQLCILDGNKFNSRCREIGEQRMEILDECEVLKNQKGEPLMVAGGVANSIESPQVVLKFRASEAFVSLK